KIKKHYWRREKDFQTQPVREDQLIRPGRKQMSGFEFCISVLRLKPVTERFAIIVIDQSGQRFYRTIWSKALSVPVVVITRALAAKQYYARRIDRRSERVTKNAIFESCFVTRQLLAGIQILYFGIQLRRQLIIGVQCQ